MPFPDTTFPCLALITNAHMSTERVLWMTAGRLPAGLGRAAQGLSGLRSCADPGDAALVQYCVTQTCQVSSGADASFRYCLQRKKFVTHVYNLSVHGTPRSVPLAGDLDWRCCNGI